MLAMTVFQSGRERHNNASPVQVLRELYRAPKQSILESPVSMDTVFNAQRIAKLFYTGPNPPRLA